MPRGHNSRGTMLALETTWTMPACVPRELCWRCTTAVASEHNSRGTMHSIVNDVDTCSSRITNATPKGAGIVRRRRASTTPEGDHAQHCKRRGHIAVDALFHLSRLTENVPPFTHVHVWLTTSNAPSSRKVIASVTPAYPIIQLTRGSRHNVSCATRTRGARAGVVDVMDRRGRVKKRLAWGDWI